MLDLHLSSTSRNWVLERTNGRTDWKWVLICWWVDIYTYWNLPSTMVLKKECASAHVGGLGIMIYPDAGFAGVQHIFQHNGGIQLPRGIQWYSTTKGAKKNSLELSVLALFHGVHPYNRPYHPMVGPITFPKIAIWGRSPFVFSNQPMGFSSSKPSLVSPWFHRTTVRSFPSGWERRRRWQIWGDEHLFWTSRNPI